MAVYRTKLDTWNAFSGETSTTQTLSNSTLTETTEPDDTTNNSTPVTTTTIPYSKSTSETVARILQPTTRTDQRQGQSPTSR